MADERPIDIVPCAHAVLPVFSAEDEPVRLAASDAGARAVSASGTGASAVSASGTGARAVSAADAGARAVSVADGPGGAGGSAAASDAATAPASSAAPGAAPGASTAAVFARDSDVTGDVADGGGERSEGEPSPEEARHADRMRKRKAARDLMMAQKTVEKGLLVVHTGAGKGKSTAAFGMVMRCIGHAMPVGIVQFIKGRLASGESVVLERFPDLVTLKRMGEGFTWETQDRRRDIAAARAAWEAGRGMIASGAYRMVVLDELNIALRYDHLPLDEVLAALRARPEGVHVVVTGRNAREELIAAADLVTEMTMVKHPFRSGVKPQAGIEF